MPRHPFTFKRNILLERVIQIEREAFNWEGNFIRGRGLQL